MTIKGVQKILRERGIRHVIGLGTVGGGGEVEIEGVPAPAPAAPPAAAAAPGPGPLTNNSAGRRPQADLFEPAGGGGTVAAPLERPTVVAADDTPKPLDRAKLKALVSALEALRAVMTGAAKR
jgi:hypothetical protein